MKYHNDERGVVFVEASVVFPIMFLIIFLMIYTGNVYWQRSKIEALTADYALRAAGYCADPLLVSTEKGVIPDLNNHQVYPYRMFDPNGVGSIVEDAAGGLEDAIGAVGDGLFQGMKPKQVNVDAKYHNYVIYSTFSVDVDYAIELPIRMIGQKTNYMLDMSTHVELPVSDVPEMIRTVDMVEDYLEQTGIKGAIEEFTAKISETIGKAKEWMKS